MVTQAMRAKCCQVDQGGVQQELERQGYLVAVQRRWRQLQWRRLTHLWATPSVARSPLAPASFFEESDSSESDEPVAAADEITDYLAMS